MGERNAKPEHSTWDVTVRGFETGQAEKSCGVFGPLLSRQQPEKKHREGKRKYWKAKVISW
jgi:hypothetical protein